MMNAVIREIETETGKAILGKEEIIKKVLAVMLAGGHILLEDIPGVGKTTLALAFSRAMDLKFDRVQFTPDLVPSDITGFSIFNRETQEFEYREGAAMCNVLLADEINRTSSKTQSALLEVMQENSITVDGVTHKVPEPFVVIATQNPIGTAGTQMLPEAQLDRFMVQLSIGYPDLESEINIMKDRKSEDPLDSIAKVTDSIGIAAMREEVRDVFVDDKIYDYIARLSIATREHPLIRLGVSPRGAIALCSMSQAWAYVNDRDFVTPDDIADIFSDVCRHRVIISSRAQLENKTAADILKGVLEETELPDVTRQGGYDKR